MDLELQKYTETVIDAKTIFVNKYCYFALILIIFYEICILTTVSSWYFGYEVKFLNLVSCVIGLVGIKVAIELLDLNKEFILRVIKK